MVGQIVQSDSGLYATENLKFHNSKIRRNPQSVFKWKQKIPQAYKPDISLNSIKDAKDVLQRSTNLLTSTTKTSVEASAF